MNVADLIVRHLEDIGVNHIFYIPGGPLIHLTEVFWKSSKIQLVYTGHECGAAFMAHGYAWSNNTLGVCCVTTGPGATNAITGIATAKLAQVPLLILTAMNSTKYFSKKPAQDSSYDGIDNTALYEKCTHYSKMIHHAEEAGQVIRNAIKTALIKRGPVHVSIPTDIGFQEISEKIHHFYPYQYMPSLPCPANNKEITKMVSFLYEAQKPLLFLGYGACNDDSLKQIKKLAETLAIPVMTTARAKGAFPEDHPLSLGVYGFSSSHHAIGYLNSRPDVILSVGVEFHENSTENWSKNLMPTKVFMQITADPMEYGRQYPGEIGLSGNSAEILANICSLLKESDISRHKASNRYQAIVQWKNKISRFQTPDKMDSQSTPIKPQRLIKDIENSFPDETIYVMDVGTSFLWASHFLTLKQPHKFLISTRNAPMGFSVAAIGCKCARPEYPVVALIGDGAIKMHGMEIATAVNNKLPIIFIVLNDARWGAVEFGDRQLGIKARVSKFKPIDCAKIAEALGAQGIKINDPGEINKELIDNLLASGQPAVLDVYIDLSECPPFGSRLAGLSKNLGKEDVAEQMPRFVDI